MLLKSFPLVFRVTSILLLSVVFIEHTFLVKITILSTLKYNNDKKVALSSENTIFLKEQSQVHKKTLVEESF